MFSGSQCGLPFSHLANTLFQSKAQERYDQASV